MASGCCSGGCVRSTAVGSLDVCDTLRVRGNVLQAGPSSQQQQQGVLLAPRAPVFPRARGGAARRSVRVPVTVPLATSVGTVSTAGLLQLSAPIGSGVVFSAGGALVVDMGDYADVRSALPPPTVSINGTLLPQRTVGDTVYYVAPWGVENANGTITAPFSTLAQAATAIADAVDDTVPVTVALWPAEYVDLTWTRPNTTLLSLTPAQVPFGIAVSDAPTDAGELGCAVFTDDFTVTAPCTFVGCAFVQYFNGSLAQSGTLVVSGCYFYRPNGAPNSEAVKLEHTDPDAGAAFTDCVFVSNSTSNFVFKARGALSMVNCSVSCQTSSVVVDMQPWLPDGGSVVPVQGSFRDCYIWNAGTGSALSWITGGDIGTSADQTLSVFRCSFQTQGKALDVLSNTLTVPNTGTVLIEAADIISASCIDPDLRPVVLSVVVQSGGIVPEIELGEWQCAPGTGASYALSGVGVTVQTYSAISAV